MTTIKKVELGIDGNNVYALFGDNFQVGCAVFVPIDMPIDFFKAADRLENQEYLDKVRTSAAQALEELSNKFPSIVFAVSSEPSSAQYSICGLNAPYTKSIVPCL